MAGSVRVWVLLPRSKLDILEAIYRMMERRGSNIFTRKDVYDLVYGGDDASRGGREECGLAGSHQICCELLRICCEPARYSANVFPKDAALFEMLAPIESTRTAERQRFRVRVPRNDLKLLSSVDGKRKFKQVQHTHARHSPAPLLLPPAPVDVAAAMESGDEGSTPIPSPLRDSIDEVEAAEAAPPLQAPLTDAHEAPTSTSMPPELPAMLPPPNAGDDADSAVRVNHVHPARVAAAASAAATASSALVAAHREAALADVVARRSEAALEAAFEAFKAAHRRSVATKDLAARAGDKLVAAAAAEDAAKAALWNAKRDAWFAEAEAAPPGEALAEGYSAGMRARFDA